MKYYVVLLGLLLCFSAIDLMAAPQIKGTPDELTRYLHRIPAKIQIRGVAKIKTHADKAVLNLMVKSEHRSLNGAIKKK